MWVLYVFFCMNITENKKHFEKYAVKLDIYDYNSITHMSPYAFAIDK